MKFLAFSDIHIHPFKQFSELMPDGLNSRLQHALNCMSLIRKYAKKKGVPTILFGGDLFHKRDFIDVVTYNAAYDQFVAMKKDNLDVVVVPGNHDRVTRGGSTHSLWAMRHMMRVASDPKVLSVAGGKVYCLPYTHDPEEAKEGLRKLAEHAKKTQGYKVLVVHAGIAGAVTGAIDYALPGEEISVRDLMPDRYDLVLLGHYHKRQALASNVMYIGSPLQHDFGDRNDAEKGFIEVDLETGKLEHIPLHQPQFHLLEVGNKPPVINDTDFYKLLVTKKSKMEMVKHLLCHRVIAELQELEEGVLRSELSMDMSDGELVRGYVEAEASKDISKDELCKIGMELLGQSI